MMTNLPIACTLSPAALKARREGLLSELFRRAQDYQELPEGHRLEFRGHGRDSVNDCPHCRCRAAVLPVPAVSDHGRARGGPIPFELSGPSGTLRVHFGAARFMSANVVVFVMAACFEIARCFAFWLRLRRGAVPSVAVVGVASLIAFAFALTRVDSAFAGRTYAAYGGIYIAVSLAWLWMVEDNVQVPPLSSALVWPLSARWSSLVSPRKRRPL